MKTPRSLEKTLALAVLKNGCLELTINKTPFGYGRIRIGKKKMIASRVMWELKNRKIPNGLLVLHRCDNPACINPKHLFLGTHKNNVRDCIEKGRFKGIENSPFVKGHKFFGDETTSIAAWNRRARSVRNERRKERK